MATAIYHELDRVQLQACHRLLRSERLFFALVPLGLPAHLKDQPSILFLVRRRRKIRTHGRFYTLLQARKRVYRAELGIQLLLSKSIVGEAFYGEGVGGGTAGKLTLQGSGSAMSRGRINRSMLQITAQEEVPRFRHFVLVVDDEKGTREVSETKILDGDVHARLWEAKVLDSLRHLDSQPGELELEARAAVELEEDELLAVVIELLGPRPQDTLEQLPLDVLEGGFELAASARELRSRLFRVQTRMRDLARALFDTPFTRFDSEPPPAPDRSQRDHWLWLAEALPDALGLSCTQRIGVRLQRLASLYGTEGVAPTDPALVAKTTALFREILDGIEELEGQANSRVAREIADPKAAFGLSIDVGSVLLDAAETLAEACREESR